MKPNSEPHQGTCVHPFAIVIDDNCPVILEPLNIPEGTR